MKEWVCREISTATRDAENGILTMETELIRCKDCKHHCYVDKIPYCNLIDYGYGWEDSDFCSRAERKDEYVTLHHDDIHFIDEDAERAFYESLAERKEK